jgi:hypothetical protein
MREFPKVSLRKDLRVVFNFTTFAIMASIAASLWDSIITPGPTPILVRAMNISFAALLALLIPLIFFTKNIHVFFLTILAAGLWIAMQWYVLALSMTDNRFLTELENAKQQTIQDTKKEE